jgi:hypothetical protein
MSGPSFATSPVIHVITHLVDRNFGKGRTILDFQEVSNALLDPPCSGPETSRYHSLRDSTHNPIRLVYSILHQRLQMAGA